jgi:long-chain acyl-CoA synthetase
MQKCIYGGSPMPEALLLAFMTKLPGWSFIQAYAMTESSGLSTFLPWEWHLKEGAAGPKIKSAGRAGAGVSLKIVDAAGAECARGIVGEIAMRGLHVMLGYVNSADATAKALRNGWLHTGDLAWMDDDGFIYVVDRAKDMIVSGGENVYSAEVENAVYRLSGVRECAVIGIPSEEWGEAVHAVVVPKEGQTVSELEVINHCEAIIAKYKCPKSVEIRSDALPQTPAGKIRKEQLREPYWRGKSKNVN